MSGFVYILRMNRSSKYYIGSTDNIQRRSYLHLTFLKAGSHLNRLLQEEWNSSGSDDLTFEWVEYPTYEEAYKAEQLKIVQHGSDPLCCNISIGGYAIANHPDRDAIHARRIVTHATGMENLSTEERKQRFAMYGEANPNFGKQRSAETREKISSALRRTKAKKDEIRDKDRSERMQGSGNHFFGKKHSEEVRAKQSAMMKERGGNPVLSKAISVNGVVFSSQSEAARSLGVCVATITHRLKSNNPKYADYKTIKSEEA